MSAAGRKPLARLLELVVAKSLVITQLLHLVGVLGFLILPALQKHVRFDENALLAGSAHPTIRRVARAGPRSAGLRTP
jgi:hypothetical protein